MTGEELKRIIGANIARLRREHHMTQAELAERINYSDKAVSKWERGESMPDVLTLMTLAGELDTDVNTLLTQPGGAPPAWEPEQESHGSEAPDMDSTHQTTQEENRSYKRMPGLSGGKELDRGLIQKLSSALVWVVALFLFLVLDSFQLKYSWMVFILAVMANAIVLLSLRAAWRMYGINRFLVSVIMWTALVMIYLILLFSTGNNVWRILPMGLVGQSAILFWFKLFPHPGDKKEDTHE